MEGCELDVLQGMDASTWAITHQVVAEVSLRCTVFNHLCLHASHISNCGLTVQHVRAPWRPLHECNAE